MFGWLMSSPSSMRLIRPTWRMTGIRSAWCGDPDEPVDAVTIAVDATAAVVDSVGARGLLLAHHPLLLREWTPSRRARPRVPWSIG